MRILPTNWARREEWMRRTLHTNTHIVIFSLYASFSAALLGTVCSSRHKEKSPQLHWVILKLEGKRNLKCANILLFNNFADDFITLRLHGFCLLSLCHFSATISLTHTHPEGHTYWYPVGISYLKLFLLQTEKSQRPGSIKWMIISWYLK